MDAASRWQILRLHIEDEIPLSDLAATSSCSLRSLQRWKADYLQDGAKGLERGARSDAGVRRFDPELVRLIEGLALTRPRPSIATIHRKIGPIAQAEGWSIPAYGTVRDIIHKLDPAMVTLALEGPASYRDKHELVLRRRADGPNAMWQADHTQLDIIVHGPSLDPVRPWLTIVLDDYARAVCGYYTFIDAPSAMNTSLALRQAFWPKPDPSWVMCGLPDVLYVDHGPDFTSDHLDRTMIDLHIRLIHSAVARPQGRGKVERFFGTINTELLATLPGHITPGISPDPQLTVTDLDHAIGEFISDYNNRTHQEIGMSPRDAWIGNGWLPRMPESLEQLDALLLHVAKPRTVQRDGIRFQGQRYVSPTLASYTGRRVTIRYDPRDISEIRVYDHNTYVCTAIDEDNPNRTVSLKEIQAARNARSRTLRAGINQRIAATPEPPPPTPLPKPKTPRPPRLKAYEED